MDPRTAKILSERRAQNPSPPQRGPSLYAQIVAWLAYWLQAAGRGLSRRSILTGLDVGEAMLLYVFSLLAVAGLDTAIHETSIWSAAIGVTVVLWATYMAGRESKNLEK
jgi:hypothetical protein